MTLGAMDFDGAARGVRIRGAGRGRGLEARGESGSRCRHGRLHVWIEDTGVKRRTCWGCGSKIE